MGQEHRRNDSVGATNLRGSVNNDDNANNRQAVRDNKSFNQVAGGTVSSSPDLLGSGATISALHESQHSPQQMQQSKKPKGKFDASHVSSSAGGRSSGQLAPETFLDLKDAIIELYLAIKIRSTEEVRQMSSNPHSWTTSRRIFWRRRKRGSSRCLASQCWTTSAPRLRLS